MKFDPYNFPLFRSLLGLQIPKCQSGSPLGNVWVHSFTFSYILGSMKCDSQASLLVHTFANPCFGREPEAKVATQLILTSPTCLVKNILNMKCQSCAICYDNKPHLLVVNKVRILSTILPTFLNFLWFCAFQHVRPNMVWMPIHFKWRNPM
jgi:hypothetical protein